MMTDRITATHLQRAAIVYVRQSSPEQVRNHAESTRIQIGLRDKAVAFGWHNPVTIVDDLGISAGGFAHRAGFQHMAAEVSLGHIGIILCFEASRLSRNSKDWAQLFEVCGHLDTLVADLDQVYDLALPDDRLILGVKGSVSEYELSLFRQRSQAAIVAKAQRGALTCTLPAGLSWTPAGQIELNPDRRVQQAIRLVLDKLPAFGSVRQVLMWLRDEGVALPTLESDRPRAITWRLPTYRMVLSMVRSPFYAGAYAFGRRESRTRVVDGRATRTSGHHKPMARWTALIRDHHPRVYLVGAVRAQPAAPRGKHAHEGHHDPQGGARRAVLAGGPAALRAVRAHAARHVWPTGLRALRMPASQSRGGGAALHRL